MKTRSRIWSVILTIAMMCSVFTFMPAAVFGEEGQDSGGVAGQGGETYEPSPFGSDELSTSVGHDSEGHDSGVGIQDSEEQDSGVVAGQEGETYEPSPFGLDEPIIAMAAASVGTAADLMAALASGDTPITLSADIACNEGVVIDGKDITINLNGKTLEVTNANGPGLSIVKGSLAVNGAGGGTRTLNITGKGYGASLDSGKLTQSGNPIINVTATGSSSTGVYALENSSAGFAKITAMASGGTGVYAAGGSLVNAESVNAAGTGVQASGSNTKTTTGAINTTGANSIGVLAQSRAAVEVHGYVKAKALGVCARGTDTKVTVQDDVSVDAKDGIGVYAGAGSAVDITNNGNVVSTGTGGAGAYADGGKIYIARDIRAAGAGAVATAGGEVVADGMLLGKNGTGTPQPYIKTGTATKTITDNSPTTRWGYRTYTDGASAVWVADGYKTKAWVTASTGAAFNAAIANAQNEAHPDYGKGIRLTGSINSGVADINIKNNDDGYIGVVIDLQQYSMTCPSLTISNASLIVLGNSSSSSTGVFAVGGKVSLDNGVFTAPEDKGKQAMVSAAGATVTGDVIRASGGSILDIRGGLGTSSSSYSANGNGLWAEGGSKARLEGNIFAGRYGVYATGKGTEIEVTGSVDSLSTGSNYVGVFAGDSAKVKVGGQASCKSGHGIEARGGASVEAVYGGVAAVTGSSGYCGVLAADKGTKVSVRGNVGSASGIPGRALCAENGAAITADASMVAGGAGFVEGQSYGAYATGAGSFISVKTGAAGGRLSASANGSGTAAYAEDGGEIYVNGDLKTGATGANTGAAVKGDGKITVDGEIGINASSAYIRVNNDVKNKYAGPADAPPTTKPGYYTYSGIDGAGRTGSVWTPIPQKDYVCRIGDDYYPTQPDREGLQEAIDSIPAGGSGTVVMLKDHEISADYTAISIVGKTVTIDLNGCNLNAEGRIRKDDTGSLHIASGGKLTFDNSGAGGKKANMKGGYAGVYAIGSAGVVSSLALTERFKTGGNSLDAEGLFGLYANNCTATVTNGTAVGTSSGVPAYGVYAHGPLGFAEALGDAKSTTDRGVFADSGAQVTIGGDAIGRSVGAGASSKGPNGVSSKVTVHGNAMAVNTGGSESNLLGDGVWIIGGGTVIVGGDATTNISFGTGARIIDGGRVEVGGNAVCSSAATSGCGVAANDAGSSIVVHGKAVSPICGARANSGAVVSVGGVEINGANTASTITGVSASNGGKVFVTGDVIIKNTAAAARTGAAASSSGVNSSSEVTVDGVIKGNTTANYVQAGGMNFAEGAASPMPKKEGYRAYTNTGGTDASVVWVKENDSRPRITTPPGKLPDGRVGAKYYPSAVAPVGDPTIIIEIYKAITGVVSLIVEGDLPPGLSFRDMNKPGLATYPFGIEGVPTAPGVYTFTLRAEGADGVSDPATYSIEITNAANPLMISPTHAIVTSAADKLVFEANLNVPNPDYSGIVWSCDLNTVPSGTVADGKIYTVTLAPSVFDYPRTGQVCAVYKTGDASYQATATVEVVPGGIDGSTAAKVLETKVTVNKAKEIGALVPVLITDQKPWDMGLSAFAVGSGSSVPRTGSQVARTVELCTQNSKTKAWDVPLKYYTANMYQEDQRFIEINAEAKAAKTSKAFKAKVFICSSGSAARLDAGVISITTVEKWPKLTAKAGSLNLFLPDIYAPLTVKAGDGSVVVIDSITPAKGKDYMSYFSGRLALKNGAKKGTFRTTVNVSVTGYKPVPAGKTPKVDVKIVSTAPKIKLSQASVKLLRADDFGADPVEAALIGLVTSDKKVPFESNYRVIGVTTDKKNLEVNYKNGVISITPLEGCTSGKAKLAVAFWGTSATKTLTLTVTIVGKSSLKPSSKTTSITVNQDHSGTAPKNFVADIPISLGTANYNVKDWEIRTDKGAIAPGLPGEFKLGEYLVSGEAFRLTTGTGKITITVASPSKLAALVAAAGNKDVKYKLTISPSASTGLPGKAFVVNLIVAAKPGAGKITKKGSIDIANPASAVTATLKPSNTASQIASVALLIPGTSKDSADFKVTGVSGNTFRIMAARNGLVPGVQQALAARVTLKNGATLPDIAVKITPVQGKGKATQSRKAVTLYKSTPMYGSGPVRVDLTKPANVRLGAVTVNPASVKAMKFSDGGFRLEQNGSNDYTIYFTGDRAPSVIDKKTGKLGKLKASYTLKLDLWAEGTYTQNSAGQPAALGYYNKNGKWVAKSKPTTVSVKVTVK